MARTLRIIAKHPFGTYYVLLVFLAGCSSLAPLLTTPTPAPVKQVTSTPQPKITQTTPPEIRPRVLRIWLPPQFDPNAATTSANILKQRLAGFEAEHPGLEVEVRIKAEEGEASLLNSLSVTSLAAPSALPDLIALSRPALETAALKGLLHPIDGLSTTLDDPNWYGYARQLGHIQNTGYGLPYAGDALIFAHRSDFEEINSWEEILASENSLAFAAGDPQGLVGLSLYVSAGGEFLDEQGKPALDQDILTRVLTLMADGISAKVFSVSSVNIISGQQALDEYQSERANMAVVWASNFRAPEDGLIMPLPGLDETTVSFATGWMWALAGSNPENQQLAVELADYLVADDFLRNWMDATGFLPTRPSSVDEGESTLVPILESAQPIPSTDVLSVLGPLMQEALVRVLNGEQPEAVAGSVVEKLK